MLFTYYVNESSSGKAGQGAFAIHPDLKPLFCELMPENLPYNSCPPPAEIVEYLTMSEHRRDNTVSLMAKRQQKNQMLSPFYEQESVLWQPSTTITTASSHIVEDIFPFDRDLEQFGASPTNWLSNGDSEGGHVPSPAPESNHPLSPTMNSANRKLSVIPEIPSVFCSSRPPSLSELAATKQTLTATSSLDVVVTRNPRSNGDFFVPRFTEALERVQQHSIESSVVTEGHYDASFETEDLGGEACGLGGSSFDCVPPPFSVMGQVTEYPLQNGKLEATKVTKSSDIGLSGHSVPSEVTMVKDGTKEIPKVSSQQETACTTTQPQGMMLWKRVRHCVVFGGAVVKPKKDKK